LLKQKGINGSLISLKDISALLVSRGYQKQGKGKMLFEEGLNGTNVRITDIEYLTPRKERAVLSYPLEKADNFYMTLWVAKF